MNSPIGTVSTSIEAVAFKDSTRELGMAPSNTAGAGFQSIPALHSTGPHLAALAAQAPPEGEAQGSGPKEFQPAVDLCRQLDWNFEIDCPIGLTHTAKVPRMALQAETRKALEQFASEIRPLRAKFCAAATDLGYGLEALILVRAGGRTTGTRCRE